MKIDIRRVPPVPVKHEIDQVILELTPTEWDDLKTLASIPSKLLFPAIAAARKARSITLTWDIYGLIEDIKGAK